jgi:hypothetical protein
LLEPRVVLSPTIFTVDSAGSGTSGSGTSGTLPYVISQANANTNTDGSEIEFDPSVFSSPQTITPGAALVLSETDGPEVIDGLGAGIVTVSGGGSVGVFQVDGGVTATLSGLTISGGSTTGGGGGVSIAGLYATVRLTDCTITGNTAGVGGGLYVAPFTTATLTGCTVSDDSATSFGGGLDNQGSATLTDCTVSGNTAAGGGGLSNFGSYSMPVILTLIGVTVSENSASILGGGIGDVDNNAGGNTLTLTDCTVSGNSASGGGGGGGLYAAPLVTATLTACTFSGNASGEGGGGIESASDALALTGCTLSGDRSSAGGGLDILDGTVTLDACTVSGNSVTRIGAGLAIYRGTITLTDCTIAGNTADSQGGGAIADSPATVTFTDCTLSGNTSGAGGGGLYNGGAAITLTDSTVSGNYAGFFGGGIGNAVTIGNTIVAGNTAAEGDPDLIGAFTSMGNNLIGETDGSSGWVGSDLTGTIAHPLDAMLAPLAYYGGPTETMALLPGSPAIDAGNNAVIPVGVTTDQRGYDRIVSGTVDIGAFESQSIVLVVNTTADGAGSPLGELDLRGAVDLADILGGAQTITFDATVFASTRTITLTAGQLELGDTSGTETITGPTAGVTVSGGGTVGVFQVDAMVTASISDLTIADGAAPSGGGIDNDGTLTIVDSSIASNQGTGFLSYGGGIVNTGHLTIDQSQVVGNMASDGGGIYNTGALTIEQSQIVGNTAVSTGGGLDQVIDNPAVAVITDALFSSNVATVGAGIENESDMTIVNSTIAGNSGVEGGGINTLAGGDANSLLLTIEDCTIVDNSGSDLYNWDILTPTTDVVVGNTIFSTVSGDIQSQGYNLIGNSSGGLGFASTDLLNVAPMLGPLQDNGGPTLTESPLPGSPAIDAGDNALAVDPSTGLPLTTDQRGIGYSRIVNGIVDIGALEVQPALHFVVTTPPPVTVAAGTGFGLVVAAEDSSGIVDTSFNGDVSVALDENPGGATLGGTTTVMASGGVAVFIGLTVDTADVGYSLLIFGSGETGATTGVFNVTAASATQLVIGTEPPSRVAAGTAFELVVSAEDPFGNVDPTFDGTVGVALLDNPGGATLGGTVTEAARSGVTAFAGLTLNNIGIGYTLQASANGLTPATTLAFNVGGPTIYTVDLTSADGAGSGNTGDLVYTMGLADANPNPAGSEIEFDLSIFSSPQTIALGATLVLSDTAGPEVIDGPGGGLVTVSGGGAVRVFAVDSGITATLSGLTIGGGSTAGDGGGLDNDGTTTLDDCTISGNSATLGGGVGNEGSISLTDCTISGNSANSGGGVYTGPDGTTALTDCTVGGNTAAANGGGVYNRSTTALTDCTVSGNIAAGDGGGLDNASGTCTLVNTIVANNMANSGGPDAFGTFASLGYNLIGETDGSSGWVGSDLTGTLAQPLDPLLAPLGDNGGPTQTMALLPGSPAIDAGTSIGAPAADQRGALRGPAGLDAGTAVDIGAYEASSSYLVTSTADSDDVGTLRAAVGWANVSTDANPANLANPAANTVVFDTAGAFASPQTITLSQGLGTLELSNTSTAESIAGPPAGVTISGGDAVRVFLVDSGVTASISGLTITGGNTDGDGGGLYNDGGVVTLTGVTLAANAAALLGGALFNTKRGTITTTNCSVTGNSAGNGGGLYNEDGTINLDGVTVSGNTASGNGGGLFNSPRGTITVTTCTVSGNTAVAGGGLYNDGGTINLTGATISGNSASGQGGGLFNGKRGTITTTNCTISGNAAVAGGGLYNSATADLDACTIADNSAAVGGGIDNQTGGGATLKDTIVAANLGTGGSPGDIGGGDAVGVVGTYDLVGTGGSGGIAGGIGDVVLTDLASLGLAPLGDYGGPTQTMPLLPGSAALGRGTAIAGVSTDQRGEPLAASLDIGAFQSQGFTISAVAGSTPQATPTNAEFPDPLAVIATPINPLEPVAGGVVTFSVNPAQDGASAGLSAATAIIGSDGIAQVTATANSLFGTYTATATAVGTASTANFQLTNLIVLTFHLRPGDSTSITYGSSATIAGTLSDGALAPQGEDVTVTVGGLSQSVPIGSGGAFTVTLNTDGLTVADAPYPVTMSYTGDATYASAGAAGTLAVTPAPLTITVADATKPYGAALPAFTARYSGFVDGQTAASLTIPASLATTATAASPVTAGGYAITASGAVDPNYTITDVPGTLTITPVAPTIAVSAPGGTFDGSPFAASATVAGSGSSDTPAVSLEDVGLILTYYAGSGTSGANLGSTPPTAPGIYTVVAEFPGSNDYAETGSTPITFGIDPATATIAMTSSLGSAVFGQSVTLEAVVAGPGASSGSVTFLDGGASLATVALDASGEATLTVSDLAIGSHAITATFGGTAEDLGAQSGPVSIAVTRAGTEIVLVPQPVYRKKKVVSLGLKAVIQPTVPGQGLPTGLVTFEVRSKGKKKVDEKVLGTARLGGGAAVLTVKPAGVLEQTITILYGGDAEFTSSRATTRVPG